MGGAVVDFSKLSPEGVRFRVVPDGYGGAVLVAIDDVIDVAFTVTDAVSRPPVRLPQSELPSHRQATSETE